MLSEWVDLQTYVINSLDFNRVSVYLLLSSFQAIKAAFSALRQLSEKKLKKKKKKNQY